MILRNVFTVNIAARQAKGGCECAVSRPHPLAARLAELDATQFFGARPKRLCQSFILHMG